VALLALAFSGCTGETEPATNITTTTATLDGKVTAGSDDKGGVYWFEWSRDNGATWTQGPIHLWGSQTCSYSGSGTEGNPGYVHENISGLVPGTHYIEYFGGRVSKSEFQRSAERYLGPGAREVPPGSGRFVSADGRWQVRYGSHETRGARHHGHFEAYEGGRVSETTTVDIHDDRAGAEDPASSEASGASRRDGQDSALQRRWATAKAR
jgi:hypothetical protein